MQQLFWQRIDQAGSPDFTPQETDRLLNWAYDVWYLINRPKFGDSQQESVNMTFLLRPFSFYGVNKISVVGAGTDLSDYRDLARMTATFDIDVCGVTQRKNINVVPMSVSERDTNQADPFNRATNEYPYYVQTHDGTSRVIEISSATMPISIQGTYFKELQVIDGQNAPNTVFEAQDYIARQIVELAKVLAKGDLDDYASVKNAVQESMLTNVANNG